jgi:hypothetical protein
MEISVFNLVTYLIISLLFGIGFVVYKFQNFMINWYKVKRSHGSKLLVEVENPIQDYFASGNFDNGYLRYKARKRADNPNPNRMISVEDVNAVVYSKFGVKCIRVDDAKNIIRPRRSDKDSSIPGYNAEKMDEAIQTALLKPNPNSVGLFDAKTWQIIVLIAFVLVIIVGVVGVSTGMGTSKNVDLVLATLQNLSLSGPMA